MSRARPARLAIGDTDPAPSGTTAGRDRGTTVPEPPDSLLDVQAQKSRTVSPGTQFQPYEHGDPSGLDRTTALIPNGWAAHDATELTDPEGRGQ